MTVELEPVQRNLSLFDRLVRALEILVRILADESRGGAQANTRVVPVGNDRPVQLATSSKHRTQLTLQNTDAVQDVTITHYNTVVYSKGFKLAAGMVLSDVGRGLYKGEWWAVANVAGPVNIVVDDQST